MFSYDSYYYKQWKVLQNSFIITITDGSTISCKTELMFNFSTWCILPHTCKSGFRRRDESIQDLGWWTANMGMKYQALFQILLLNCWEAPEISFSGTCDFSFLLWNYWEGTKISFSGICDFTSPLFSEMKLKARNKRLQRGKKNWFVEN